MKMIDGRLLAGLLLCSLCVTCVPTVALAQESQPTADAPLLNELRERLLRLEQELNALKKNQRPKIPEDKSQQRVVMMLESCYLGRYYNRSANSRHARFFVAKLNLVNLTPEAIEIQREQIELVADGTSIKLEEIPKQLLNQSVQIDNQYQQLRNKKPSKKLKLSPGGMQSTWVVFDKLDDGTHVPDMTLKVQINDKPVEIDVNASQKEALEMEIERIGPRGSLGLATINGKLNTINIGGMMDDLDQLATQQVIRVVLRWSEGAAQPDQQVMAWIIQNASSLGANGATSEQFPPIPATMREFHLSDLPKSNNSHSSRYRSGRGTTRRVHDTADEAVQAALASAYQSLPRDEILTNIEQGHLLSRVAALASGGGRLGEDKLPIILEYADAPEPQLQRAALTALGHFGDSAAVEKLVFYVKKNNEPLASAAIESLAGSRYSAAHDALLTILKNEPPASQKNIVRILAAHPRPIWSEAIYEFVKDPRDGLNQEALQALTQVGHPKLLEVLKDALSAGDMAFRNKAYTILAARTDHDSEQIAIEYALQLLGEETIDPNTLNVTLNLLNRVKDKRAAPLLLKHFSKQSNKQAMIRTLTMIGDKDVAAFFVEHFEGMKSHEKGEVLKALLTLHAPEFRELATSSLINENQSVAQAAAQVLQQDGSPESVDVLTDALKKTGNNSTLSAVCNVLAQLATPQARTALEEARDDGDPQKRRYARNALQQIYERSSAYQFLRQGHELEKSNKLDEALAQFVEAIKADPKMPDGYIFRGNLNIRRGKFAEARPDFDKALELDRWNSQALTGACVVMVMDGDDTTAAVKRLEENRARYDDEAIFSYNAACVYSRAAEHLKTQESTDERKAKIKEYTDKAIADLQKSVKQGFGDLGWMREDPDLKTLHEVPEFRKVAGMGSAEPKTDKDPAEE
ncbi:Tetratricopeptide repeat protein [Symmachiella macrocystis]|uniref:Tetratricopeptide repeat protein n=1 Tax=Symmachiella macrocystis TaxID=2527985 RepID=A0A5C6BM82_9PLAN|nr:HEAT repeat domain-containing protein [Symmachiella macrocystis]TWU13283.1 Tetratricopeptide repeat protein [Symmachiella macrocystis]